jgi:hypothetical protein
MNASDLYGLPLDQFTAARNALAKELRKAGEREEAADVAKLRKPSVAAWAVNQLVRTQKQEVAALFKAGDALQKAQADLLAGRVKPGELREAVDAERAAVDRLVERGRGLLSSEGHELGAGTLEQVGETLHAAALENEARSRVRNGCLERELRHVGLGVLTAGAPAGKRTASAGQREARSRKREARSGQREAPSSKREARSGKAAPPPKEDPAQAKARAEEVRAARRSEADARRAMERAARGMEVAQERRDRAADQLAAAEEALAAARERAEEARSDHERSLRRRDELK